MDLNGKELECIPVIVAGIQWDGETLKQGPTDLLVHDVSIQKDQTSSGYTHEIINSIADELGIDAEELKNYYCVVRAFRCHDPGDSSSDDDVDLRTLPASQWGVNCKQQHLMNANNYGFFVINFNKNTEGLVFGSGNWAATETFKFLFWIRFYKVSVGVQSKESIAVPAR